MDEFLKRLERQYLLSGGLGAWLLQTQIPPYPTPLEAAAPAQGGSLNLVIGVIVLVVIILGGLVWARRQQ